eukprot:g2038.t1
MKVSADGLTSGTGIHVVSKGNQLMETGKLISVEANYQTDGTLLDISATKMESGTALRITGGSAMDVGKLLEIETMSEVSPGGVFVLNANSVKSGKVVSILANSLTSGTALEVSSGNGTQLNADGKLLSILGTNQTSGTLLNIDGSSLTDGYGMKIVGGPDLSAGSLLYLESEAVQPVNGIFRIDAKNMTSGKIVSLNAPSIAGGTVLDIQAASTGSKFSGKVINIEAGPSWDGEGVLVDLTADYLTTGTVLDISAKRLTTGHAIKIESSETANITNALVDFSADGLTTGRVLYVHSNSSDSTSERTVMEVRNEHPDATKAQTMRLVQLASESSGSYYRPAAALAIESSVSEAIFVRSSSSISNSFYVADDLVFTLGKHDVVPVPGDGGMTLYRTGDIKMDGILTVNNKVYFNDDVAFAGDIVATTGTKTANRSIFKYDENDQLVTGKINIGSTQTTVSMYQLDIGNPTTMASVTKEGVLTVQDFVINGDIYSDVDEPKYIFTQRPGTSITLGGATAYVHIPGTLKVGGGFGSGPLRIGQLSGYHSEMTIGNSSVFSVDFPATCGDCNLKIVVNGSNTCTVTVGDAGSAQYAPGDKLVVTAAELTAGAGFDVADDLVFTLAESDVLSSQGSGLTFASDGNVSTDGSLHVVNDTFFSGDVTFGGNILSERDESKEIFTAITSKNIQIGGAGSTVLVSKLKVGGGYGDTGLSVWPDGNISTDGHVQIDGNLEVEGDFIVNQNVRTLHSGGPIQIFTKYGASDNEYTGTINVGGVGSTLNITGNLNVGGGYDSGGITLDDSGNATISGSVVIDENLEVAKNLIIGGNITLSSSGQNVELFSKLKDGSAYDGDISLGGSTTTDLICLGDTCGAGESVRHTFGCCTTYAAAFKTQTADGIIGLSDGSGTLFAKLRQHHSLQSDIFGLCLGTNKGFVSVGTDDSTVNYDPFGWSPMVRSGLFYKNKVQRISLADESVLVTDSNIKAVTIDSGTSYTYIPYSIHSTMKSKFEAYCNGGPARCTGTHNPSGTNSQDKGDSVYCAKPKSGDSFKTFAATYPSISFSLNGGVNLCIPPAYYFFKSDHAVYCIGFFKDGDFVFGANIMNNYNVVFDHGNTRIGWARAKCEASASNEIPCCGEPTTERSVRDGRAKTTPPVNEDTDWFASMSPEMSLITVLGSMFFVACCVLCWWVYYCFLESWCRSRKSSKYSKISDLSNENLDGENALSGEEIEIELTEGGED